MEVASVKELKLALGERSHPELVTLCLRLAKFKKENKELLTYLLFEAAAPEAYVRSVKAWMDGAFGEVNSSSSYYIKKQVRKILRQVKKYIRFALDKEIEAELLFHFCRQLRGMDPSYRRSRVLKGLYEQQYRMAEKAVEKLHEDLQFDFEGVLEELRP